MRCRLTPQNRRPIAATYRKPKCVSLTEGILRWTRLPMRSPHWSEPLSLLHVGICRLGAPAKAATRTPEISAEVVVVDNEAETRRTENSSQYMFEFAEQVPILFGSCVASQRQGDPDQAAFFSRTVC